jgi:hypothetical protein
MIKKVVMIDLLDFIAPIVNFVACIVGEKTLFWLQVKVGTLLIKSR